ncbi:GTP cyclohydrolase I [Streptomyces flavofungini]|nr:GTP cyclohydrolase I [Streptomyces flavofungini]WJV51065.1 GTP cyclohydrolase I [Streptomyces flavofungini]
MAGAEVLERADPWEDIARRLLVEIGEDPQRDGLRDTPGRFARWWREFTEHEARRSNVLTVTAVSATPGAPMPTIVAGAESGLTLMSFQNEYLMYAHLRGAGHPIRSVRCSLRARGEFVAYIECDEPSADLVREAMAFDVRSKVIVCGPDLSNPARPSRPMVSPRAPSPTTARAGRERMGLPWSSRPRADRPSTDRTPSTD